MDLDLTVSALARKIDRPRPTVSATIHGCTRFPRVRQQIKEVLGV